MDTALLFLALAAVLVAAVFSLNMLWVVVKHRVPFVPTPPWALAWLVENMSLTPTDVVYDLGCGDARLLSALATRFPEVRFIGIETMWWPYMLARWKTRKLRNITIRRQDFLRISFNEATHVFVYLIPALMRNLEPKLRQELRPTTAVWSYGFELPGWLEPVVIRGNPRGRLLRYTA